MSADLEFRAVLVILLAGMLAIRAFFHIQASASDREHMVFESRLNVALRTMVGLMLLAVLLAYLLRPEWMAWASLPFPAWLRWLGAAIGIIGLAGLFWVQHELGRYFSGTLHLIEGHRLVMSGPYRFVRHPMYTVFYLVAMSFFLLSANWLIGGGFIVALTAVMVSRVGREEMVMMERFGDEYRAYIKRTGRFLPRFRLP